nr:MAG TPA: hypothetical protein [Bacteriophage sp.]
MIAEVLEVATVLIDKVLRLIDYLFRYVHNKRVFTKVRFLFDITITIWI